ncbi:unnamed protein product [Cylicocyclus nassatus]|uniref:Uncharacterized protein n=1 Tax=Cylicocyclus nassatus TaxID=53992 RepID=A0AA36DQ03_CYLNA|nr:unnamed protein product [Cylicocyclus nassatus]
MRLRIKFPYRSLTLSGVGTILFVSLILSSAILHLHPPIPKVPERYTFRADFASLIEAIKNGSYNTSSYDKAKLLPPFHRYVERFEELLVYGL